MFTVFKTFFGDAFFKLKLILAVLGGILFWVWNIKREAREIGRKEVRDEVNKETKRVKDEWQKIDSSPVSIDDAISGLQRDSRKNRD